MRAMKLFGSIFRFAAGDRFVGPMFRRLFLPSVVFSAGWALSDIADAVVVGQRLGATGLAAIGMVLPVYAVNSALAHGAGLGGSVGFSRLMAHGEFASARRCFVHTLMTSLFLSGLFAVFGTLGQDALMRVLGATQAGADVQAATREYLTVLVAAIPLFHVAHVFNYFLYNDDKQRLAVLGAVLGNASDIALNFTLVLGFDLGMRGAAFATVAGQAVTVLVYLVGLAGREHHLRPCRPRADWLKAGLGSIRRGFSSSVSYLYLMVFVVICNNVLVRIGGDSAVAVFDVVQNASYLLLYLYEGTVRAVQPLVSTFHGESGRADLEQARRLSRLYGNGIGLALALAIAVRPDWMCALFGVPAGEVGELTELALRVYCAGVAFAGINVLDGGYFVACGVERASLAIQSLRGAVFLLPLTVAGGLVGDVRLFWLVFPLAEAGSWAVFRLLARRPGYAVGLLPEERVYRKTVSGSAVDVMAADDEIRVFCEGRGIDARRVYTVTLAVEEICATIVKNGMRDGAIRITLLDVPGGDVLLMLRYSDGSFNPFSLQTEEAGAGGRFDMDAMGILMIRKRAKDFAYRRYQGLNSLVVRL